MSILIQQNKYKIFVSILIIAAAIVFVSANNSESQKEETKESEKKALMVGVQKAGDARRFTAESEYPAMVVGDQEVKILSRINGTAQAVNFDLGNYVGAGKVLVRIDDQGMLKAGENDLKSAEVRQLEIAVEKAEESLDLADEEYDDDETDANETAKEIAELELKSAKIALENALNERQIAASISGFITSRQVSIGDAISAGQTLATVSRTGKIKIQFFVSKEELASLKAGNEIKVRDGKKEIAAKITNISPQADPATKRFLIEAVPQSGANLIIGTIIDVILKIERNAGSSAFLLPLAAIITDQNESYFFIIEDGKSKKVPVEVVEVLGETAEIKADVTDEAQIIIDGAKLVKDGEDIEIKQ